MPCYMGKLRGFRTINIMFFIEQQKYWVLLKWVKGSPKKPVNFEDIVIKGGWVLVSKPNFFFIRNYDIYQRWVGVKHRGHKGMPNMILVKVICFVNVRKRFPHLHSISLSQGSC